MGHFSVYCQISKITIAGGQDAVMLPLRPVQETYREYGVALLPMFGKYNNYDNIELNEQENSKEYDELVQKYYGCSLQEFANNLVHINREDLKKVGDEDTIEKYGDLTYCWIDRQVWDYITNNNLLSTSFYLGYPELLEYLGFTFIKKDLSKDRYNLLYTKDGVELYSDGTWLRPSIYGIESDKYGKGLDSLVSLDKDKIEYLRDKKVFELKELFSNKRLIDFGIFTPFGVKRSDFSFGDTDFIVIYNNYTTSKESNPQLKLLKEIVNNLDPYYDLVLGLRRMFTNFFIGTYSLEPYVSCRAPQDGEFAANQLLLDKFSEINKGYIYIDEDDY